MPFIPYFSGSKPLADAPAPVLDHQQRPTVNRSAEIAGVGALAKAEEKPLLDGKALAAPYEALGSVGKAVMQAGSVVGAWAQKEQEVKTFTQTGEAKNAATDYLTKFDGFKKQNPNEPDIWLPEFERGAKELRSNLLANEKLTPQAKANIGAYMDSFMSNNRYEQQVVANRASNGKARDIALTTLYEAEKRRDLLTHQQEGLDAYKVGVLSNVDLFQADERYKAEGEQQAKERAAEEFNTAQEQAVDFTVNNGKDLALRNLERGAWGKHSAVETMHIRQQMERASDQSIGEVAEMLANGRATGQLNSPAAIDAAVANNPHVPKNGVIVAEAKRQWEAQNLQREAEDRRVNGVYNSVAMLQKAKDYDPSKDREKGKEGLQYFTLMQETKLRVPEDRDGAITGELNRKFYGKLPPPETSKDVMSNLRSFVTDMYDSEHGVKPWRTRKIEKVEGVDSVTGKKKDEWKEVTHDDRATKQNALDDQTRILTRLEQDAKLHPEEYQDLDRAKKRFLKYVPDDARGGLLDVMAQRYQGARRATLSPDDLPPEPKGKQKPTSAANKAALRDVAPPPLPVVSTASFRTSEIPREQDFSVLPPLPDNQ